MDVLTVAKKPTDPEGAASPAPPTKKKIEYTTLRLYADDGEDLSDLADMEEKTIAEMYRLLCAALVRERRIKKTEEKLNRLKKR